MSVLPLEVEVVNSLLHYDLRSHGQLRLVGLVLVCLEADLKPEDALGILHR
jgi:hypothetical protein